MADELALESTPALDAAGMGTSNVHPGRGPSEQGLPEDDGMRPMRKRIADIQGLDLPANEKSRLIHAVMMEQYTSTLTRRVGVEALSSEPAEGSSQGNTSGLESDQSTLGQSHVDSPASTASGADAVVTSADRIPTYWVPPTVATSEVVTPEVTRRNSFGSDAESEDGPAFGCEHYKRNVKLQCSTCARWYTCRFCHDEMEDHKLIRRDTRNMLCMFCGCAQPAAGVCRDCEATAAYYYCDVCKLWDNDSTKSIYHCDDCGICRRGEGLGRDFFHCHTCRACLSISIRETHRCIERSTDCDCPICGEYMFTSPQTVVFMRCGHSIHQTCYHEHKLNSFKCPICSRSIINMEFTFQNLDRAIEAQPMPPQFQDTTALVYCNDCCARSEVRYHWLGLKCAHCDSYNTAQLQILSNQPAEAATAAVAAAAAAPDAVLQPSLATDEPGGLPAPQPTLSPPTMSREASRGRAVAATASGGATGTGTPRRATTSASAVDPAQQREREVRLALLRNVRSFSGVEMSRTPSISETDRDDDDDDDDDDGMDAASDDDIDFLGLFPRRQRQRRRRADHGGGAVGSGEGDENDEEESESDDSLVLVGEEEDSDDSSDDDPMDILGHR